MYNLVLGDINNWVTSTIDGDFGDTNFTTVTKKDTAAAALTTLGPQMAAPRPPRGGVQDATAI